MSPPSSARAAAPELSVVMPAHNESGFIEPTLKTLVGSLRERELAFELLVVENGSTDSTFADASAFAAADDHVGVLTLPVADYGEAMRAGILAARAPVVVVFDVDYFDPQFVDVVLPRLTAPDGPAIVVGSKRAPGTRDTRPWPRRVITAGFSTVLRVGLRAPRLRHPRDEGHAARRRRADRPRVPERRRPLRHRARAARRSRRAWRSPRCRSRSRSDDRREPRSPRRIARTVLGLVRLRVQLWRDDRRLRG